MSPGSVPEEGEGGVTEVTPQHKDPLPSCTVDYWVLGQNCAWWATTALVEAGRIKSEDIGADRFVEPMTNKPWNSNQGIYTFSDPDNEGGINGNPALRRPPQACKPGCFRSDLPRPKIISHME